MYSQITIASASENCMRTTITCIAQNTTYKKPFNSIARLCVCVTTKHVWSVSLESILSNEQMCTQTHISHSSPLWSVYMFIWRNEDSIAWINNSYSTLVCKTKAKQFDFYDWMSYYIYKTLKSSTQWLCQLSYLGPLCIKCNFYAYRRKTNTPNVNTEFVWKDRGGIKRF